MFRDLGYYWLRLGIYIALAISLATVFNDLDKSNGSIQVINNMKVYIEHNTICHSHTLYYIN